MHQSQTQKSLKIKVFVLSFIFFFFHFFLFSTTFSGSFLFSFKFFPTVTGSACIFLQSLIYFLYFLSISCQLLILCLLLLSIAYEYPSFLSSFFFGLRISRVFFPKPPKLPLIQPTKFPPQNT